MCTVSSSIDIITNILRVVKREFCATSVAFTQYCNTTYCRLCYNIATYLLVNVMKTLVYSYVYFMHLATDLEQTLRLCKFIICPAAQKVSEVTCSNKVTRSS